MKFLQSSILPAVGILSIGAALAASPENAASGKEGIYEVTTPKGTVIVQPLSAEIFRVTTIPAGETLSFRSSQSAILSPGTKDISVTQSPEAFTVYSPTTSVRVDKVTGNITFHDSVGNLILSENGGVDNSGKIKTVSFDGDSEDIFYGAGERGHKLNLNGDTLVMYNRQNYGYTGTDPRISQMGITAPYFASGSGYGVLFDDYNDARLILGDTISYTSDTPHPLSYYFINGNGTLSGVTEGYTLLTGRQDLPPFWSLGYITSKYGYRNQKEAVGAIDTLRNNGYPVDGIVLDLYWYGVETDMGRLAWDEKQFPDHRKMLADLKEKGVNTVLISQPYINKKGAIDNYNFLKSKGMLVRDSAGGTHDVTTWVGDAGMFDMSNPDTREWLWNRLKGLTTEGVAGWWGDLGEPEVHPLSAMHANGESAAQYHNVYGNEWSRLIYEGLRKDFPEMRPLLMMRGGTAGLQRYSVFPWTTDVSRSWGGLTPQINLMLSSGLSGLGYMSSDLGGFAVDPANPRDEELYVRWVQMGAFTPVMRTHAQYEPEPYHYPQQEEILKKFIKMRYEWLPYNYTLAYENAAFGYPLARPLNFFGSGDDSQKYASISDEYLWGNEILIAPVMEAGATRRKVVFPEGEWINWNDPRLHYKGRSEATVEAPLDILPMFVKAGSFVPLYMESIGNVTQYDPTFLTVKYFPSAENTRYVLFDDDRKSPESLSEGKYQLTTFTGESTPLETVITISAKGSYPGMPELRMLTFEIENADHPSSVSLSDGSPMPEAGSPKGIRQYGWSYDTDSRTLYVRFPYNYNPLTLTIR